QISFGIPSGIPEISTIRAYTYTRITNGTVRAGHVKLANFTPAWPATKQEEAAAKALKKNLIELIAARTQQQVGLPAKEAHRFAAV
ncbi:inositol phosphate phosphatase SopB, partial [Salmonella enterica subsp. enterica serovar Kentucky]|nr:inositol phosphate phosphatase SopB [Salmonella enterica subsp. enterica serovar Kentucky]